jgi:hypothetical protein
MSASAAIATFETAPDYFTNGPGVCGVAAGQNSNEMLGGSVQLLLGFVSATLAALFPSHFRAASSLAGEMQDFLERDPVVRSDLRLRRTS